MAVPSYNANPLRALENATLTFGIADGALETLVSGNVQPVKRTVSLRAWVRSGQTGTRGKPDFQRQAGVDQVNELLTASLLDPLPAEIVDGASGTLEMATANGGTLRGTFRLTLLVEAAREFVQPILGQKVYLDFRREVSRAN
jgi:hypothetical protein